MLLIGNTVLQQGNLLLCANISLLQAIYRCVLIINWSKVIFYPAIIFHYCKQLLCANHNLQQGNLLLCANISRLQAICC